MKKDYSKPVISFESFQLASSIASSCASNANHHDYHSCAYNHNGLNLFIDGNEACLWVNVDEDGVCYDGPLAAGIVFSS